VLLLALAWGLSEEWTVLEDGVAVRELPKLPAVEGRKVRHLDDRALSGVTLARAFESENSQVGTTVAVGRGQLPGVGRWVYVVDDTVWWQVFWDDEGFHQALASAPVAQAGGLASRMTAFEASRPAGQALLFDANRADCQVTLKVDINQAQSDTRQLEDLRLVLTEATPLAALRAGGLFDRHSERCVHAAARNARACRVVEGAPSGPGSVALQAAVTRCLDEDAELLPDVKKAIEPWL